MDWTLFPIYLAACIAAGSTGAFFGPGAWYRSLNKPGWTPPDWVFPTVWTVLYLLISVAAARVAPLEGSQYATAFFALQMVLNALWSPVFFGLKRMGAAMGVLACLWIAVAATLASLWTVDRIAGALFVPYLVWVTLAGGLNYSVWRRNRDALEAG